MATLHCCQMKQHGVFSMHYGRYQGPFSISNASVIDVMWFYVNVGVWLWFVAHRLCIYNNKTLLVKATQYAKTFSKWFPLVSFQTGAAWVLLKTQVHLVFIVKIPISVRILFFCLSVLCLLSSRGKYRQQLYSFFAFPAKIGNCDFVKSCCCSLRRKSLPF